ncbi:hypothetical protein M422DRAFT_272211 [Sphaerobolus stellatus SS14]|uniref:Uncharacterized protein n=1 Tax=Sphaerobolus stellatus (strain SS14) TaxID=990650 RepID=A0A0C9UC48_SPHS4|nr:hypothetical protein M422DRAFT_272211 [Sphaerobolus stellatus SS14]
MVSVSSDHLGQCWGPQTSGVSSHIPNPPQSTISNPLSASTLPRCPTPPLATPVHHPPSIHPQDATMGTCAYSGVQGLLPPLQPTPLAHPSSPTLPSSPSVLSPSIHPPWPPRTSQCVLPLHTNVLGPHPHCGHPPVAFFRPLPLHTQWAPRPPRTTQCAILVCSDGLGVRSQCGCHSWTLIVTVRTVRAPSFPPSAALPTPPLMAH